MEVIDICNMTLGWLGGNSIMTLDDQSVEAQLCKMNYPAARDKALESVDWTFARSRARLVPLAEPHDFHADEDIEEIDPEDVIVGTDFNYHFQLPPECLVVRWVSANGTFRDSPIYDIEGRQIYANTSTLYIKYTVRKADTRLFPPHFRHLVATCLAEQICVPLTGSKEREVYFTGKVEVLTDKAGGADGVQTLPQQQKATRITRARFRHV